MTLVQYNKLNAERGKLIVKQATKKLTPRQEKKLARLQTQCAAYVSRHFQIKPPMSDRDEWQHIPTPL